MPADVIRLLRGPAVEAVSSACHADGASGCPHECRSALEALQRERCYPHLTQPQTRRSRTRGSRLVELQGIWYSLYPSSGVDLIELEYDPTSATLSATKLTGNQFVRAGRVTWDATPTSCRVVSSLYAGAAFAPRWDPCSLITIDTDHLRVRVLTGADDDDLVADDDLVLVRASAPLLFEWSERRSPTHGFDRLLARCGISVESAADLRSGFLTQAFLSALHHSTSTVVLDQALMLFPLLLLGGWQLSEANGGRAMGIAALLAAAYCCVLCLRLRYLGWLS